MFQPRSAASTRHRIAVVANTAWYIANFRLPLMCALREAGHEVIAVSPPGADAERIEAEGFEHFSFPLIGGSIHPLREASSIVKLRTLLMRERVSLTLSYTPKGNIYTSLARTGTSILQIATVTGLGSSFIRQNWLTRVVMGLYKLAFATIHLALFENEDDRQFFLRERLVDPGGSQHVPGAGIDLNHFAFVQLARPAHGFVFLLIARLVADKGIREYVEAARRVQSVHPQARFQLLGTTDSENPTAIPQEELQEWLREGVVEHLGYARDVRPYIEKATCVVLPSYREGLPRSLVEAAAMGRPLIATDVPGCREVVQHDSNGLLCASKSAEGLAAAMRTLIELPFDTLQAMGLAARKIVEARFSDEKVIAMYLDGVSRASGQRLERERSRNSNGG